jgi:dsRNA-specific ribonuclease
MRFGDWYCLISGIQEGQIQVRGRPTLLYCSYKGIEEGDTITRRHGSNRKMKEIAEAWGFQTFITENPCQDHPMPQTLASTVEAIVGAVWFDSEKNFEAVRNIVERLQSD